MRAYKKSDWIDSLKIMALGIGTVALVVFLLYGNFIWQ